FRMYHTLRTLKTLLVIALVIASAGTGFGQNLETMQPFDMVVPTTYGGGTRPNEGFYFDIDFMAAWISRPGVSTIGSDVGRGMVYYVDRPITYEQREKGTTDTYLMIPTVTINPNDSYEVIRDADVSSYDTGMLSSGWVCGRRYDIGYMWGHHGIGVSIYDINPYTQSFTMENAKVAFDVADKPGTDHSWLHGITTINGTESEVFPGNENNVDSLYVYGELGVKFSSLTVFNKTQTNGVELNYTYRFMPSDCFGRRYGIWEMDFGVRYFQFREEFNVYGTGGCLSDSWWNTTAQNNLIGPQIAARYFRTYGRWTFDFQAKFMAAINNQSIRQNGVLGSNLSTRYDTVQTEVEGDDGEVTYQNTYYEYIGMQGYPGYINSTSFTFNHHGTDTLFSPVIEARFNAKLQITQLVNLRMGYTLMYVGNVARPAEMVDYSIGGMSRAMGINMNNNKGDSLVHGFTIGLEVNR
ncbi:MAG: BBP7 family outer membrane beta-barrel protein, partial [Thermoguttaceae bacterium]|nr:BBP7 family outer membrane beta-barrel protein [Thermoguttaceae bacterium]